MSAKPSSAVQAQGSPHLRHQRSWAVRRPTAQGQASGHFQSAKQPGPCHCPPCLVLLAAEHLTPGLVSEVQRIQWSPEPRRPNAWTPSPGSRPRATRCSWPFFKNTANLTAFCLYKKGHKLAGAKMARQAHQCKIMIPVFSDSDSLLSSSSILH